MKDSSDESCTVTLARHEMDWLIELLEDKLEYADNEDDYLQSEELRDRLYAVLGFRAYKVQAERATTMQVTLTVYARTPAGAKEKARQNMSHGNSLSNWTVEELAPEPGA